MKYEEFLVALGEIKNKFQWIKSDGTIRGYKEVLGVEFEYCPLTAVLAEKKSIYVTPEEWVVAAKVLEYTEFPGRVVRAADSPIKTSHFVTIRHDLICTLGLEADS